MPPPRSYAFKNNILMGATLPQLLRILWPHLPHLDYRHYFLRLVLLVLLAMLNTIIAAAEWLLFSRHVAAQPLRDDPVFILGHPRTGTTLLHNLLSMDASRFTAPTTFQCGFPSGFLLLQRFSRHLSPLIDKKRPMDNVELSFSSPQEDELATNVLSGGASPYMPVVLPRSHRAFRPFFSSPPPRWTAAFLHFLRKVTLRALPGTRLLLKSPVHTSRIRLLARLFPRAQFIFMHRDPHEVYRSAMHMADTTYPYSWLQEPSRDEVREFVLSQGEVLHRDYLEARHIVGEDRLVEVGYANLATDMVGEVQRVYRRLGWTLGSEMSARLAQEKERLGGYRVNRLMPGADERDVHRRWGFWARAFGYSLLGE